MSLYLISYMNGSTLLNIFDPWHKSPIMHQPKNMDHINDFSFHFFKTV